jgi:GNAT superfamily N-acetyltransferase
MIYVRIADKKHVVAAQECLENLNFDGNELSNEAGVLLSQEEARLLVAIELIDGQNVSSEQVVGAMILKYDDYSYNLVSLACRLGHTRKGIGSALVQAATRKCQAEHVPKLWCWSLARFQAKPFYEKQGFDECYYLRRQYFGEDCWILAKNIQLNKP